MKYYIWVLGCAMNNSDAERIGAVLNSLGYTKTEEENKADLVIVVACSVRQSAINRIYGGAVKWRRLRAKNPNFKAILTGCVLKDDLPRMRKIFDVIFEIDDLGKLPGLLGVELGPDGVARLAKSGEYLGILPAYDSKFRAYVPIMTGCNNFCSYCAVPYTRGREKSRSESEILTEVKGLIESGYKEITLLGQNVNSYGINTKDISNKTKTESHFVSLLKKLDEIPGEWRGYFYSNHPKDMSDELIETLPTLKHFPAYIHLPLQSGSDNILRKMNRQTTQKEYLDLVAKIRASMPDVNLTTDIMVGYPGETEADFKKTLEVIEVAKYDMIFSAQYSPRAGTPSAKIKDNVSETEKIRREKALTKLLNSIVTERNQKLVGTTQMVLIDGQKSDKYYGRTAGYKVVEIKTDQPLQVGQLIDVVIESAGPWKLFGRVGLG